jgi:hypothetical protein
LDPPPADPPTDGSDAGDAAAHAGHGDLERLREILIGDERRALDAARTRIAELENAQRELPRRLPDAAIEALRGERTTTRIAQALSEPVAQALGTAVQRNRQGLIDALFPIIGPLIRKSIAEALRILVLDLNGAIESSFTPRGLKWRIEAWRAGVPYAQVVLKHRLAYGIDHVFLIESESGLVLRHESAPGLPALDADAIAGMLTALGDFVDDSVGQGSAGTLDSAQVGDHLVWVEHGPRANLACFMRGVPPTELRSQLEKRLEDIHARFPVFARADNANAVAESAELGELLTPPALLRDAQATPALAHAPSRWPMFLALLLALTALAWYFAGVERWNQRVDGLRAQLQTHPGFVLRGIDTKPWRALTVRGLIDPDAEPLAAVLRHADLGEVEPRLDLAGYLSSDDAILVRRAERLLAPPDGIRLAAASRVLTVEGRASAAWIERARERAAWIPAVARVEFTARPDADPTATARAELDALRHALVQRRVVFADGAQAMAGADAVVDAIADDARRVRSLARTAGVELAFTAVGVNDDSGTPVANALARAGRAQWLADALAARGIAVVVAGEAAAPLDMRAAYLRVTIGSGLR